jgi:hypothetical protein
MAKGHVKISGNLNRVDTLKVKGIMPNGDEVDLGCYRFEIKADVKCVVGDVVLYCRGVEIDLEGNAEIKGET